MSKILPTAISRTLRVFRRRMLSSLSLPVGAAFLCLATSHLPAQQTATSIVEPATPTYADAVTGLFTIPGQPTASGTVGYSIDGGATATASLVNGNAYLNLGQFAKGQHVLKIESLDGPGGAVTYPPPVNFTVTDQAFAFVGTEGLLYPSGYTSINGIISRSRALAIDNKDTVYIADDLLNQILLIDVLGNFTYLPIKTLPSPISGPAGLAFDSKENLFIADSGNSRIVKYTPDGSESALAIPGLGHPGQLVIDKSNNLLYIVDQDNNRVLRYDLNAGTFANAVTGATSIRSIAVDRSGVLLLSDDLLGALRVGTGAPIYSPVQYQYGIFADREGNTYVSDRETNAVFRIDPEGHQTEVSDGHVPSYGAAEDSQRKLYFLTGGANVVTFSPFGSLAPGVLRTGNPSDNSLIYAMPTGVTSLTSKLAPASEFVTNLNEESCPQAQYPLFQTWGVCSIPLYLTSSAPGVTVGDVQTTLSGGPTITTLLYGNAIGSAPAFSPGTQTQTPSGATVSAGVALDQLGNYYVADSAGNKVYETSSGATRALGFSGLSEPGALAVDGTGVVYVLDSGNNRIAKLDSAASQTSPVAAGTGNPLSAISSFAIDGGGQIYFAGQSGGSTSIYLYDREGGISLVASGLSESISLTLDPYGNIYSLQADGSLIRLNVNRKLSTLAPAGTFSNPAALAVDASQTAYVAQSESSVITLLHPDGTKLSISVPALGHAAGIAIDGTGNILAADSSTNQFTFVDRTHQDFNFGDVVVNTTKTFTSFFTNSGTQPFLVEDLPGDRYFMPVTTSDACGSSAATTNIPAAGSCNLSYTTSPTQVGPNTQYFRVTTDASLDFDTFTENVVSAVAVPTLTPANADFVTITIGHAGPAQIFTLSNSGGAALAITSVGLSGTNAGDYSIAANTCGTSLAAGGSCAVTLNFKPTASGTRAATLSVVDIVGTQTATLTGKGIAHPISISPASYDFELVTATNYKYQDFTLTNVSSVSTSIDLPSITEDGSVFTFATNPFCGSIAPGAACTITIKFDPLAAGAYSGTLNITDAGGPQAISLKGSSVTPSITLTPANFNYGAVTLGNFLDQAFILKNTSDADIVFYSAMINQMGSDFSFVTAPDCTQILPGATCTFNVRYYPSAIVNSAATLVLTGTALNVTASLTGHSILPTGTLTPAKFDFGAVTVGNFLDQSFTFKNTSNGFISISSSAVTGNGFSIITQTSMASAPNCARLNPGDTCVYTVRYMPTAVSSSTGTFTLVDTAGTQIALLSGHAILPTGTLTPASFNYGTLPRYNFLDQSFTFKNTSNGFISISSSAVTGNGFSIITQTSMASEPNCARLNPGDTCVYTVRYLPTTVGPSTGTFTLVDTAGTQTAVLTGKGISDSPQLVITPSDFSFGAVSAGSTETQVVTLTNAGTAQAHFSVDVAPSVGDLQFGPTGNTCQTALSPSESCSITIQITGAAAGGAQIAINVTGNSGTNSVSARLVGFGADTNATPSFIDLGNGFTADSLTLNGAAAVNTGSLQLTANQASQASSAFYPTAMSTTQFSTSFAFQLLDPLADGITFTIQGEKLNAIGSSGSGLGYQGIAKSIALKFGLRDATGASDNSTGIYVNGAAPTTPAISLAGSGIDLHSGHIFQLGLQYDGTTETITLTDTSTNAVWTTSVPEDIPSIIGGNTAYFGFTAATGAATANADVAKPAAALATTSLSTTANILNWNYVNQSVTVTNPTDPGTLSPTTLNFGNITVGSTSGVQTAKLTNTGTAPFTIASITASDPVASGGKPGQGGTDDPGIFVLTSFCSTAVTPGNYCKLEVTLAPGKVGPYSGNVVVKYYLGDGTLPSENFTATLKITGAGGAPALTISSTSLDFKAAVGINYYTAPLYIFSPPITETDTLTNPSSVPITFSSLPNPSGDFGTAFSLTPASTCNFGNAIAPGASCTLVFSYSLNLGDLTSNLTNTGTLTLFDSAGTQTITLTGHGFFPSLTISSLNLDYGAVPVGTSVSKTITLTNNSAVPVLVDLPALGVSAFGLTAPYTCYPEPPTLPELAPGASCNLVFSFTPTAAANYSGTLSLRDLDGSSQPIAFTGRGFVSRTVTPTSLDFGAVMVNTLATKAVTITNTSTVPITGIGAVAPTSGDYGTVFSATNTGTCSNTVAPGASCTLVISFIPKATTNYSGTFSLLVSAGTQQITLTGHGIPLVLNFTPNSLDFGPAMVGTTITQNATITNTSVLPVTVGSVSQADSSSFPAAYGGCLDSDHLTIAPGASCTISFRFSPRGVGTFSGTFSLGDSVGTQSISLTGQGTVPSRRITPTSLDFGAVTVGATATKTITITNTSSLPITDGFIAFPFTGDFLTAFLLTSDTCGYGVALAPGASCTIVISFTPTASTNYSGSFGLLNEPATQTVTLTGQGVAPSPETPFIDFGKSFPTEALTLSGPATVTNGALQLTAGPSPAVSSAFYPTPEPTSAFASDFTCQLLDPTAEGITFTIQGDNPNAVGLGGGGLGYQGLAKSIAVKFDLKDTAGEGVDSTGIYVNGAAPTIPAISLASSGIDLHSGHVFDLHLTYDRTTLTINLTDTVTGAVWTTQVAEDIPTIVGGSTAYFGFTASSGTPALTSDAAASVQTVSVRPEATASAATPPATSNILTWIYVANGETKTAQTISFGSVPGQTYGTAPITLGAKATSGLPVSYTVTGPAKLSGSTLTLTGAGEVTVTALQLGNASFAPALPITESFAVAKAPLTVTATSLSRAVGAANPSLTYTLSGFVDGDIPSVVGGAAVLTTTAVPTSPAGKYPITFSTKGLTAANYSFNYLPGTLTISSGTLVISPTAGNFGRVAVGTTSSTISFTVRNDTSSTISGLGHATNLGEFDLQPGTCPVLNGEPMLGPGQSCVFTAVFKPTKAGPANGDLSIQTSSGTFNVPMSGEGSTLVISPAAGNFGSVKVGQTSPVMSFTVTNDTTSTMGYLGYANLGEFYLQPGTCHLVNGEPMLNPGKSCVFTAVFKPTKVGAVSGNMSIQTSSGTFNVLMSGMGATP